MAKPEIVALFEVGLDPVVEWNVVVMSFDGQVNPSFSPGRLTRKSSLLEPVEEERATRILFDVHEIQDVHKFPF